MKRDKVALLVAMCVLSISAYAQDSALNREIVIEKEYKPTESAANKLNTTPAEVVVTLDKKELEYSSWAVPATIEPEIQRLSAVEYQASQIPSDQKGYIQLALGAYLNNSLSAGYRVLNSEKTSLNLWGNYTSTWLGENRSEAYDYTEIDPMKQKFSDLVIGADLSHLLSNGSQIKVGTFYHNDYFNYYGAPIETEMQSVNEFNLQIALISKLQEDKPSYWARVGYNYWGNDHTFIESPERVSENLFSLTGAVEVPFHGASKLAIDVEAEYAGYSDDLKLYTTSTEDEIEGTNGIFLTTLTPSYRLKSDKMNLQIGINLDFSSEGEGLKFHVSPAVKFDYQFSESFGAYANLLGGEKINSFSELSSVNRYFNPSYLYGTSDCPIDINAGLKFIPIEGMKGEVSAGYAKSNNQMLPYYALNSAAVQYSGVDLSGWFVAANLEYNYKSLINSKLGISYTPQDGIDSGYILNDDRAEFTINAEVGATPIKELTTTLGYEYRGNRKTWGFSDEAIDLGNVNNLYIEADYQLNKSINLFANLSNILCQKWDNYLGYGAQGFGVMVGASFTL